MASKPSPLESGLALVMSLQPTDDRGSNATYLPRLGHTRPQSFHQVFGDICSVGRQLSCKKSILTSSCHRDHMLSPGPWHQLQPQLTAAISCQHVSDPSRLPNPAEQTGLQPQPHDPKNCLAQSFQRYDPQHCEKSTMVVLGPTFISQVSSQLTGT